MKPEETIDFHIRWAWHSIARLYNIEAARLGGSMSVGYVLLNIDLEKGCPSTKLGPKMGMEPRSLTRTLKSMEKKGLIFRQLDTEDKRKVRIFLTDSGKQMRTVSKEVVINFNKKIRAEISEKKLHAFFDVMNEINRIIERTVEMERSSNTSVNFDSNGKKVI